MDKDDLTKILTPEQYAVTQEGATEAPFTGKFFEHSENGMYTCIVCGQELFSSDTKFESTAPGLQGWPAFSGAVDDGKIKLIPDHAMGTERTEIRCANCDAHLGHLFEGVPGDPADKHYCVNSCALNFKKH